MNAYLLVYDRDLSTDYKLLHEGIKADSKIVNWWHYLNSAYILISNSSANELTEGVRRYVPSGKFLIVKITRSDYQGYLSKDAWKWIHGHVPIS